MAVDNFEKTFTAICVEKPKKRYLDTFTKHPDRDAVIDFLSDKLQYYLAPDSDYLDKYDEWGIINTVRLLGEFRATQCTELLVALMDEVKDDFLAYIYSYTIDALSQMGESALNPVYEKYQQDKDDPELNNMWLHILAKLGVKDSKISDAIMQHYKTEPIKAIHMMGDYGDKSLLPVVKDFVTNAADFLNAHRINPFEYGVRVRVPEADGYIEAREDWVLLETGLPVDSHEFDEKVEALDKKLLKYAKTSPKKEHGDMQKLLFDLKLKAASKTIEKTFAELQIQSTFGRAAAILLAGHCYPEYLSMDILYPKIYDRDDVEFDSMEQAKTLVNAIMDVWNYYVDCREPYGFIFLRCTGDVEGYVKDRTNEIEAYLDIVLYKGSSDIHAYTKKSQIEIDFIQEGYQELKRVISDKDMLPSVTAAAVQDRVMQIWEKMLAIKEYEKERRQKQIKEGTHQQRIVKKKVGRNVPCPCGSGKKYKHCCLN